ncbi:MAG: c-type cytochrome [Candidatus Hydrogenedentes bacterium]|nr:c-type cytochrome [Candidatus Hydrogenedentota bacterium]
MTSSLAALFLGVVAAAPTPQDILADFEIHPGFTLELVAMEPVVLDPVDLEFDERGRAFVLEMPGYPFGDTSGFILLLQDENGDGLFDQRIVFAEGFPVADAILPWRGGLLVASPPDLIFVKDTDGDDKADLREMLLSGFDTGNTQHNFNGLTHGLDNWVYGASGGNGGEIYWPDRPAETTPLRWNDFRIDIDRKRFERIGQSSGGFGLAIDEFGRVFGTHNMVHASHLVFPGRFLANHPGINYKTLHNISDHEANGTARLFALGEPETRVNHPEQSGYFSGACGITFYTGGAFGATFTASLFVNDVVANVLHRDVLVPSGPTFVASRDRERVEFLASRDRAFRPVNGTVGPDGAYYVVDMHRAVIEHPEWIPDEIEKDLDLRAGMEQGRLFRIVPEGGLSRVQPAFPRNDLPRVVQALEHSNKWWRDTAQRLLVEWQDPTAEELLGVLLRNSTQAQARVHALWTLHGLHRLSVPRLLDALQDQHPGVRENALLLAEEHLAAPEVFDAVIALEQDPDQRVRMYAALVLSTAGVEDAARRGRIGEALFRLAGADASNEWSRRAVLAAAADVPMPLLIALLRDPKVCVQEGVPALIAALAEQAGRTASGETLRALLVLLREQHLVEQPAAAEALRGFERTLGPRAAEVKAWPERDVLAGELTAFLNAESLTVVQAAWRLGNLLDLPSTARQQALLREARDAVADPARAVDDRVQWLQLLALAPFSEREDLLFVLLATRHPREVQQAAIDQLVQEGSSEIADRLIGMWKALGPPVRAAAGNMLLRRKEHHDRLLTALETGKIALGEMNFDLERRRVLLRWAENDSIKRRAEKLFNDAGVVTRAAALEKIRPALDLPGDAGRGHQVYLDTCAKCHVIGDEGTNVGPNLTDIFRKSKETLLHDILDPNAAVDGEFISFTIETNDADVFAQQVVTGMIVSETDETVVLREAGGVEHVFPRSRIESMTSTGLSMMPEELEAGLMPQTFADLLAFLQQSR